MPEQDSKQTVNVQELWVRYEAIAMHFNDLLIKLRTQSLAGIAAVSTIVGVFPKTGIADAHMNWLIAKAIFAAMACFWVAIWCLDLLYYNRLLDGAVNAIKKLENQTKTGETFDGVINMSTLIDEEFDTPVFNFKRPRFIGVALFYGIVFLVIVAGELFAMRMEGRT